MKKMMMVAMMMVMAISANAMSYTQAKSEALFLSDKMAYELNLTDAQYDAVYEINLDYLLSVNGRNDAYGAWWNRRNADLQYVLTAYQYNKYMGLSYFYRPISWNAGTWTFNIYSHYTDRAKLFKARPTVYVSYRGGNNRKANTYYADRRVSKPNPSPANNGSTWRVTNNNRGGSSHFGNNRQVAQNTNGNGHFGGRR